jgi:beta-lactamase regulating signal transducer with metallopeptidase domain
MNGPIEFLGALLILLAVHATVLLSLVWMVERLGGLKHPGWAEFAWRAALFGALLSVAFEAVSWRALIDGNETASSNEAASASAQAYERVDRQRAAQEPLSASPTEATRGFASRDVTQPSTKPVADASTRTTNDESTPASTTATTSRARAIWEIDGDWLRWIVWVWALGTGALTLWTLRQAFALRRLKQRMRRDQTPASDALRAVVETLAARMGQTVPQTMVLPDLASPLVFANTVLLPRWAEGLDRTQQIAMLAHELAHLRRRDPLWRPLQRIALIPLFFHPLAWHALRRLETLAETLCDRVAIEYCGDDRRASGRALAECLAECLARGFEPRGAGWALAMAERNDGTVGRVRSLLETSHMTLSNMSSRRRWIAIGAVLMLLIALPSVFVVARDKHTLSIDVRDDGNTQRVRSKQSSPGERLRVEIDGKVEFNAEETDIARMDPGAEIEIEQTRQGNTRELRAKNVGGEIRRRYFVDGKEQTFDAEGKAWLAQVLPDLFRLTGLQMQARTRRMLAQGGAQRVLDEIAKIKVDHVRGGYIAELLTQASLNENEFARTLALIDEIDSDFETRQVLERALAKAPANARLHAQMLELAAGMDSEFERAEWLSLAARRLPIEAEASPAWAKALAAFDSDFERRRTLEKLIDHGRPRAMAVATALVASEAIDSDFERRSALQAAAASDAPISDAAYLKVADGIDSDFERREALLALIGAGAPSLERSRGILRSASSMSSDFEQREVLVALAARMPNDAALIADYRLAARKLGDYERGQAEEALDRF